MYRSKVSDKQVYKKRKYVGWDPDSSPRAWDLYLKVYEEILSELYGINRYLSKNGIRLRCGKYVENVVTMGADTDFSFRKDSNPFSRFKEIILNDSSLTQESKDNYLIKLESCSEMHHTLVNFSIMPQTGGMNNFKRDFRFDRYIKDMARFFDYASSLKKSGLSQKEIEDQLLTEKYEFKPFKTNVKENNRLLLRYLLSFETLSEYCRKIYFIDSEFIEELTGFHDKIKHENTHRALLTGDQVYEYCCLAEKYWDIKEKAFYGLENTTNNNNKEI